MKKILLGMLFIACLLKAETNNFVTKEFWQSDDKQKHFAGSYAMAATGTALARHYGKDKLSALAIGVGGSILVGWLKEVSDGNGNGTKDINDLDADVLGAIAGGLTVVKFEWKF
ncbi:MAG: hypothetical protein ACPG9K_01155 [Poseidonibacter sp.]